VQIRQDDYRRRNEDNQETSAGLRMGYQFTQRASLSVSYSRRWQKFDEQSRANFYRDAAGIQFDYQMANSLTIGAFYEFESRQYEDEGGHYNENVVGLSLAYTL
jgi:outer membrane protein assembly factor BamA